MNRFKALLPVALLCGIVLGLLLPVPSAFASPGDLDPSFGTGGRRQLHTYQTVGFNVSQGPIVQSDGKILAWGYSQNGVYKPLDFAIARYLPDGSPDPVFGTGGRVTTDIDGGEDSVNSLILQPDGKILAGGQSNRGSLASPDFALARYFPDGGLDPSFGNGGKARTNFRLNDASISSLALQSDGLILAGGYSPDGFTLARYHADGSLDPNFGTGGKLTTHTDFFSSLNCLALQNDGKIIACGVRAGNNDNAYPEMLVRYLTDGSLDSSFGAGGIVTGLDLNTPSFGGQNMLIQRDGKILTVGSWGGRSAVSRYLPDGSRDAAFGTAGRVLGGFVVSEYGATPITLMADGSILTGPAMPAGTDRWDCSVMRLFPDGSQDPVFGIGGRGWTIRRL